LRSSPLSAVWRTAGRVRTFAAWATIAAFVTTAAAVALTSTAIGATSTVGTFGAIPERALRVRLGTFLAVGGRVGRAVEGAVVAISAV